MIAGKHYDLVSDYLNQNCVFFWWIMMSVSICHGLKKFITTFAIVVSHLSNEISTIKKFFGKTFFPWEI